MAQGRSTKIISMIMWTRTSRLSIKISLSVAGGGPDERGGGWGDECVICLDGGMTHVVVLYPKLDTRNPPTLALNPNPEPLESKSHTRKQVPCGHQVLCGECALRIGHSLPSCPVRSTDPGSAMWWQQLIVKGGGASPTYIPPPFESLTLCTPSTGVQWGGKLCHQSFLSPMIEHTLSLALSLSLRNLKSLGDEVS